MREAAPPSMRLSALSRSTNGLRISKDSRFFSLNPESLLVSTKARSLSLSVEAGSTSHLFGHCASNHDSFFGFPTPSGWANFCRADGAQGTPAVRFSNLHRTVLLHPSFPRARVDWGKNSGEGRLQTRKQPISKWEYAGNEGPSPPRASVLGPMSLGAAAANRHSGDEASSGLSVLRGPVSPASPMLSTDTIREASANRPAGS